MNLIKTLKTNWRDIAAGVGLTLIIALVADAVEHAAATEDGLTWLANVTGILSGLSRLAAANLAAWFILAVAWPTINRYSNESFAGGWENLRDHQKFGVFVFVATANLIAASIVFAG